MTYLQRQAINDCIDQRELALSEGRVDDARTWDRIILHSWEAYNPTQLLSRVPHHPSARYTRDGYRIN